jgi:hypothetical protein
MASFVQALRVIISPKNQEQCSHYSKEKNKTKAKRTLEIRPVAYFVHQ